MTNLHSVLKSRDITLWTKVCVVKAMVFPGVMYGCESWTMKKPEHLKKRYFRIDAFKLRRRQWHPTPVLLPGKSHGRRSLVGCSPWGRKESDTTERLQLFTSYPPWRRKWQPTPLLPGEFYGQRSLVGCSPWGHKVSGTTEWLTLITAPNPGCHPVALSSRPAGRVLPPPH